MNRCLGAIAWHLDSIEKNSFLNSSWLRCLLNLLRSCPVCSILFVTQRGNPGCYASRNSHITHGSSTA